MISVSHTCKLSVSALLLCVLAVAVVAYPAFPGPYELPLPDGSSLRVWATGDEFTGLVYVDAEGRSVHVGPDGKATTPTPARNTRTGAQATLTARDGPSTEARERRARFDEAMGAVRRARPLSVEPLVFVLVQYADFASSPGITDHIQRTVFNASSGAGDTINTYFGVQSNGKFRFAPAMESSSAANDGVVGPVTVNCTWVNQTTADTRPDYGCLQRSALLGAAAFLDLKKFDVDGDGDVSGAELHVVLVVAGGDAGAMSPLGLRRCPHVWGSTQPGGPAGLQLRAQGVTFGEHVVIGENWGDHCAEPFGIGPLAHELGHTLSLPDLYDTAFGISIAGPWCLMDGGMWSNGGRSPGMLSPFLRSYLGWLAPTVVPKSSTSAIALPPVSTSPDSVLQFGPNPNGVDWELNAHSGVGEYFLVENRKRVGCDAHTPGSGVLVWHVNEATAPTSNRFLALSQVARLQRANGMVWASGPLVNDVLTSSARASLLCSASGVPNSLLDNSSASCVSLSAAVDNTTLVTVVEPWTDAACAGSCVYGASAAAPPTRQYSVQEIYGASPVPAAGSIALPAFYDGYEAQGQLPFDIPFGGVAYSRIIISQRGWINFVYGNDAATGEGPFPTIAPCAGEAASAVLVMFMRNCTAPYSAGPCLALQWDREGLSAQAVLTQKGDVFFVYSGNSSGTACAAWASTGATASGAAWSTRPAALWSSWSLAGLSSAAPVVLRLAPREAAAVSLPLHVDFDAAEMSTGVWGWVTGGSVGAACGATSGSALTFVPTLGPRAAATNAINVSGCRNVSVAVDVGPASSSGNCTQAASVVRFAAMRDILAAPQWAGLAAGRNRLVRELLDTSGVVVVDFGGIGVAVPEVVDGRKRHNDGLVE
eukprot:m51a1_g952 hypothetical protein (879) ;mRNA; f:293605-296673